jgi:Domain of unknown function (DUF397)
VTSSHPADNAWRKSTASEDAACVEVFITKSEVLVRHSQDPLGSILRFTPIEWHAFLVGVRNGEFDIST